MITIDEARRVKPLAKAHLIELLKYSKMKVMGAGLQKGANGYAIVIKLSEQGIAILPSTHEGVPLVYETVVKANKRE